LILGDLRKVLILLGLANDRGIEGRTRLQKTIFLLQKKYKIDFGYEFVPYYFGPYSKKLQIEISALRSLGLVEVSPSIHGEVHRLTRKGKELFQRLNGYIAPNTLETVRKRLEEMNNTDLQLLVTEAKQLMLQ